MAHVGVPRGAPNAALAAAQSLGQGVTMLQQQMLNNSPPSSPSSADGFSQLQLLHKFQEAQRAKLVLEQQLTDAERTCQAQAEQLKVLSMTAAAAQEERRQLSDLRRRVPQLEMEVALMKRKQLIGAAQQEDAAGESPLFGVGRWTVDRAPEMRSPAESSRLLAEERAKVWEEAIVQMRSGGSPASDLGSPISAAGARFSSPTEEMVPKWGTPKMSFSEYPTREPTSSPEVLRPDSPESPLRSLQTRSEAFARELGKEPRPLTAPSGRPQLWESPPPQVKLPQRPQTAAAQRNATMAERVAAAGGGGGRGAHSAIPGSSPYSTASCCPPQPPLRWSQQQRPPRMGSPPSTGPPATARAAREVVPASTSTPSSPRSAPRRDISSKLQLPEKEDQDIVKEMRDKMRRDRLQRNPRLLAIVTFTPLAAHQPHSDPNEVTFMEREERKRASFANLGPRRQALPVVLNREVLQAGPAQAVKDARRGSYWVSPGSEGELNAKLLRQIAARPGSAGVRGSLWDDDD